MDTIKRDTLVRAVALLGFDPVDVAEVRITRNEVTATIFERDEHGNRILGMRTAEGEWQFDQRVEVCNVS